MRGERPIEVADEDRLGRAPFAKAIAGQILDAPSLDSFVVAVMGPWGSGKTSLVNMVVEEAKQRSDALVLSFNPWLFSGAEQLVGHFFQELGAQFSELETGKIAGVGAAMKRYAGLLGAAAKFVPGAGPIMESVADLAKEAGEVLAAPPSIATQRKLIQKQLAKSEQRIIVVLDDIDRLDRDEIRELVKLVRLTADFPNVVYVLAFDRRRVEQALGEDGETGRAYLEKIVQVGFDVPLPLATDLTKLLQDELNLAVDGIDHGPFDAGLWTNVFYRVVRPLVRSPRDIRRYVNSAAPTVRVIGKEVALQDVLALEAVRVFLPDTFAQLPRLRSALTGNEHHWGSRRDDPDAAMLKAVVEAAGDHRDTVKAFFCEVFPASARHLGGHGHAEGFKAQWRRHRRAAIGDVLDFYLHRRLPENVVRAAQVFEVVGLLGQRDELAMLLGNLSSEEFENLLGQLEAHEEEFPPDHAAAAIGALMDQSHRLREEKQHLFDMGADMALHRVVLRLLRRIDDAMRTQAIGNLLPTLTWISAQRELVRIVEAHKLTDGVELDAWKQEILERFTRASKQQLEKERLLGVLVEEAIARGGEDATKAIKRLEDDRLYARLLASVMGESISSTLGSLTSHVEQRLPWKRLEALLGADWLKRRTDESLSRLSSTALEPRQADALKVAARYVRGWRPKDRPDDDDEDEESATRSRADAAEHVQVDLDDELAVDGELAPPDP